MFNSLLAEYKTPFGAVAAGEELSLRFALPAGDGRTPELLLYRAGQALPLLRLPLSPAPDGYRLRYTPAEPGLYYYGFRLSDGTLLHRAPDGSADYGEGPLWQLTVYDKNYSIPQKFAGQVMYQIFPDRFCSSGRSAVKYNSASTPAVTARISAISAAVTPALMPLSGLFLFSSCSVMRHELLSFNFVLSYHNFSNSLSSKEKIHISCRFS